MEKQVLTALEFELTFATPLRYLERYAQIWGEDKFIFSLASYALELSLIEVYMNKYTPDMLACGALFLGAMIGERAVSPDMYFAAGCTETDLKFCANEMCQIFKVAHTKRYYKSIFKKYTS